MKRLLVRALRAKDQTSYQESRQHLTSVFLDFSLKERSVGDALLDFINVFGSVALE